jgi:hypothetical protein
LEEYTKINGSNPIRFSADSGFYEQGFSLEMEAEGVLPKGAQIRYTLDGSEPGIRSTLYEGPVRLEVPDAPAGTDKKSVPDQNTEAEKETAIHIREIQRRELPDRITEEQACNYFMVDLIFE